MSGVPGWSRAVILPHQREISPSFCTQRRQFEILPPWWLALGAPVGCFARRPATESATKSMRVIRLADGAVQHVTGRTSGRRPCCNTKSDRRPPATQSCNTNLVAPKREKAQRHQERVRRLSTYVGLIGTKLARKSRGVWGASKSHHWSTGHSNTAT